MFERNGGRARQNRESGGREDARRPPRTEKMLRGPPSPVLRRPPAVLSFSRSATSFSRFMFSRICASFSVQRFLR